MQENQVIVFRILPERGHLYASFYFAQKLQSRGYRVIYAAVKEQEAIIIKNGFDFYPILPDPGMSPGNLITKPVAKFRFGIRTVRSEIKKANKVFFTTDFFSTLIQDLNPVAFIIDKCFILQTIQAYSFKIPLFTLESTVSTAKFKGIPSLNSYWIPRFTFTSDLMASIVWNVYLLGQKLEKWLYGNLDEAIIKTAQKGNYPLDKIDFKRFQSLGYLDIPELIVSPEEFDFPHQKNDNQLYIGPSLFANRKETGCDPEYYEKIHTIKEGPVIYCAMGTLSWRYKGINRLFDALVAAFAKRPDWNLILCIDDDITRRKIRAKGLKNVHVFKRVPQKELLESVDIMINHGGMNSITECILSEVPMLVYPGSALLDQVGNSSRVVYHQLGLRGKLRNVTANEVVAKIETILSTPSMKQQLKAMREKIMENRNYDRGVEVVEAMIKTYYQTNSHKLSDYQSDNHSVAKSKVVEIV